MENYPTNGKFIEHTTSSTKDYNHGRGCCLPILNINSIHCALIIGDWVAA